MENNLSIFRKLLNLTKATLSHVALGMPKTEEDELQKRTEICADCDSLDKEKYVCNECGCFLNYKLGWAGQKCPKGKW